MSGTHTTLRFTAILAMISAASALMTSTAHSQSLEFKADGSIGGAAVSAELKVEKDGDKLNLKLKNTSKDGVPTRTQLLTGIYFRLNGMSTFLNLASAVGKVSATDGKEEDDKELIADSDKNKGKFQFKQFDKLSIDGIDYQQGISTVGNSARSDGSFNGNIVGSDDYGIITGNTDRFRSGLSNIALIRDEVQFSFTGFDKYSTDDISDVVFNFGSAGTDYIHVHGGGSGGSGGGSGSSSVPEPSAVMMLAAAGVVLAATVRPRRKTAKKPAAVLNAEVAEVPAAV